MTVYCVVLRFADRERAGAHLQAHREWIDRGLADGVFLLVGSLASGGGAVLAAGEDRAELARRVAADPFVMHGVVGAEILEIDPARVDGRLAFVLD